MGVSFKDITHRWWDRKHGRELDAIAERQGEDVALKWADGIAPEQLVTVEWHNFWKGMSK